VLVKNGGNINFTTQFFTMYQKIVVSTLLLFMTAALQAQSKAPMKRDSFPRNSWEIGVDVLSLFEKNNVPAASIFFRRNYAQSAFRGKAWRFQVGMDTEVRNFDSNARFFPDTWRSYCPYLGIGHEWQFSQNRFKWFAGVDLTSSYQVSDTYQLLSIADSTVVDAHLETLNIRLNGILGAQWALTKSLSVALESSFFIQYESYFLNSPSGKYNTPQETWGQTMIEDKKFTTSFQPFWAITFIYQISSHELE